MPQRGQEYIAAPVFGRPEAAEAGKLFVVAAGKADVIERCRPVLETIGQRVFVMGDKPEMANVVKLSGNFLIASIVESLGRSHRADAQVRHRSASSTSIS